MTFRIINILKCVPFYWNPENFLDLSPKQDMTLGSGLIMFVRSPRKYNCISGKSGEMMTFVQNGKSYAAFWSDFKNNTKHIPDTIPLDVDGDIIKVGDRVCYARSQGMAIPCLEVETVTEIITYTNQKYHGGQSGAPDKVKIKMGKKSTFDTRTRIKII